MGADGRFLRQTAPGAQHHGWLGLLVPNADGGATWYIDAEKKWSFSALNRYEFNYQKDVTGITPGQAYTLEWGAGRALSPTMDVGLAGYCQQKVTEDTGPGASNERDRVAGIGPEVTLAYSPMMLGCSLRYAYEFMAESRLQGHTVALTITKRF